MGGMRQAGTGCLLGLALGDAIGAPHEGGLPERALWWLLGTGRRRLLRWTDDTQMTLALIESYEECGAVEPDDLAARWAADARWRRGYGRGALQVLRRIRAGMPWEQAAVSVFPDGSYGNGAAMRVAPLGLLIADDDARRDAARRSARITHAHPLGIEGALLMAEAAHQAAGSGVELATLAALCRERVFRDALRRADELVDAAPPPAEAARILGASIRAHESVPLALHAHCRFRTRSFEELLAFVCAAGGDTDTIGAMAGALHGAARGPDALPAAAVARLEARERILAAGALVDARRRGQVDEEAR